MRRIFKLMLAALAAGAVFAGLVHAVLVATHLSESADATVYGLTPRRIWATGAIVLGLAGVFSGSLAVVRRSAGPGPIVALVAGGLAMVNGGLNLAMATGGPGTGNGVVGGAAAFVLGMIAVALGSIALTRRRRAGFASGQEA